MINIIKKVFYAIWMMVILIFLFYYIKNPEIASPEFIIQHIKSFNNEMMLIYIVLSLVRGFFLIPSTPFVIAGALLFPSKLLLVLCLSIIGVVFSATSLYYFSDLLGLSKYFERKDSKWFRLFKTKLKSNKSTYYVLGWSFFPFVPTDLICYVAGVVKMPFKNMILGVFAGELVLDIIYVYLGNNLFQTLL